MSAREAERPPTSAGADVVSGARPVSVPPERSWRAWLTQTSALSRRQLVVWLRHPGTVAESTLIPALMMVMFKVVLGDAVGKATGHNSIYGTVPLVILVGSMSGTLVAAIRLNNERGTGLLARLYVLPINRAADLSSRVVAELCRILVGTLVLLVVGVAMGFRFNQGIPAAVGIVGVALLYGMSFSFVVLALAVNARPQAPIVPAVSLLTSILMFFNSGFSPTSAYPGWLQPIVANQPMTPAIEVMRSLASGGPIAGDMIKVLVWAVVLAAFSVYPALHGYRKAATAR